MENYLQTLLIVCPLVFIAGFVDSIAGGGGLITMPAYILAGLPAHVAFGSNKFSSTIGGAMATAKYAKSGKVHWKTALMAAGGSLLTAWIGAKIVMKLSEETLQLFMLFVLPVVAIFLLTRSNLGEERSTELNLSPQREMQIALAIGQVCGLYDGLFGPGTGTFLILGFSAFMGMDLVNASGNAKVVNLASNLGACIVYLLGGKVLFAVAIPAAICSSLGNILGARTAIKGGSKIIKPIILLVVALLLLKIATDLFG